MQPSHTVAIIGGGITGLSAAYYLQQSAENKGRRLDITLIEAEPRLGGKVLTERHDGFLIEGGPESFLAQKPWALQLAKELGLEQEVVRPTARQVYLLYHKRLQPIPEGLLGLVPARASELWRAPFFSIAGKLRASLEPITPRRKSTDDESLGSFLRRRLGKEWEDRLGEPVMAGIHAGDGERLSMQALYGALVGWEQKYGSLVRAMRKERPPTPRAKSQSPFVTFRGGADVLTNAIAKSLTSVKLLKGQWVRGIAAANSRYLLSLDGVDAVTADSIILTTPSYAAADILRTLSPQAADHLAKLRYASTAGVTLAFPRDAVGHSLNGSGFLVPRSEPFPLTACTWTSAKWEGRSPKNYALLRGFVGWMGDDSFLEKDDAALVREMTEALRPLLGLRGDAEKSWVHRWKRAMPQYELGHLDWMKSVENAMWGHPNIVLTGAAFRGVGLPDCVRQGHEAADKVMANLS